MLFCYYPEQKTTTTQRVNKRFLVRSELQTFSPEYVPAHCVVTALPLRAESNGQNVELPHAACQVSMTVRDHDAIVQPCETFIWGSYTMRLQCAC